MIYSDATQPKYSSEELPSASGLIHLLMRVKGIFSLIASYIAFLNTSQLCEKGQGLPMMSTVLPSLPRYQE